MQDIFYVHSPEDAKQRSIHFNIQLYVSFRCRQCSIDICHKNYRTPLEFLSSYLFVNPFTAGE